MSWPSSEEVAFSFAKLVHKNGSGRLNFLEFRHAAKYLQLELSDLELQRVFDLLDGDQDGLISLKEFQSGATESPFLRSLVKAVSKGVERPFLVPSDFDYSKSTAENYEAPLEEGFHGEFADIREHLDYTYHSNYMRCRQLWQDTLIQNSVILAGRAKGQPWLVHTCDPDRKSVV